MADRSNSIIATLAAAMLIPRIQKATGVTLTSDDVVQLFAAALVIWHAAAAAFERYFPPPKAS